MDFDALRAAVVPGAGVVARWPGVVCVAECADRNVLRQLLDVCAAASGHEPGRALARRLAMWLGGADAPGDGLRFGTVAITGGDARAAASQRGEQWAVFLYGPVGLVVPDRQVALSGAQSVAWTDRLLPRPDAPVVLALEGGPIPPGLVDGVHDLRVGVVPGAGAVLVPGGDQGSGDNVEEPARSRQVDSRWLDVSGGDRQWGADPAPTASAEGLHPGEGTGNGLPSRGGLGSLESYQPGDPGAGAERPSGRAHLRPVPSGSNGLAHRGWVPRRGPLGDLGRVSDVERGRPAEPADDPGDVHQNGHQGGYQDGDQDTDRPDDQRETEAPSEGGRNGNGNGARSGNGVLNGAAYDLLGGPEAPSQESERSPWSDGRDRDEGRPDRIEGWFATPTEGGPESGPSEIGPADRRRRRHRLPDDAPVEHQDMGGEPEPAVDDRAEVADERGSDDFASVDPGAFGAGSAEETRIGSIPPIAAEPGPQADAEPLDDSADGTPRLGVPAQEAPQAAEEVHPLADTDADSPHTTALRSERILGAPPAEQEFQPLDDGGATSGLVVDNRPEEPQRPPVGLLVFDDGATYTVDAEYLMGRMPEVDPRVASGAVRSLALEDTSGAVSRVHAQIVVNGWEALLVDVGSRNGTFVSPPGEQGWTQLPAGETHRLVPGTRVRIGGRSFQFEAPSGAR